jgi:hypothetical protein
MLSLSASALGAMSLVYMRSFQIIAVYALKMFVLPQVLIEEHDFQDRGEAEDHSGEAACR